MANSKTAGKLPIFDPAMKAAAAVIMEAASAPQPANSSARNRKGGGRNVRISGYIPPKLEAALRDEVIRRTVEEHRTISFNDVLCDALEHWMRSREAVQ